MQDYPSRAVNVCGRLDSDPTGLPRMAASLYGGLMFAAFATRYVAGMRCGARSSLLR
jgi:hypothetical protein